MYKLDKEHFIGFKQLFEKLHLEDTIMRASTPAFQNFKKNANEFLKKYPNATDTELSSSIVNTVNIIGSIKN